ncbi:hypothetical protein ACJ9N4_20485 [Enterobacter sp. LM3]|uniref:hypothetical protein n=1 Tax=Enterobacter sp. LM3 TaxID=3384450 RepID=UPI003986C089
MTNKAQLWPEGELFTREVVIPIGWGLPEGGVEPVGYEDFSLMVTFIVPPFDVVVETWRNTEPAKSFGLFRQFIVGWDQEDALSDKVLTAYLYAYPGTDEAIFSAWCKYMQDWLVSSQKPLTPLSIMIN